MDVDVAINWHGETGAGEAQFERLLVTTGRRPNIDNLGEYRRPYDSRRPGRETFLSPGARRELENRLAHVEREARLRCEPAGSLHRPRPGGMIADQYVRCRRCTKNAPIATGLRNL